LRCTNMQRSSVVCPVLVFLLMLSFAMSSFAQDSERKPTFFVGYSNLQAEGLPNKNDPDNLLSPDFLDRRTTMHGVNGEVTLPFGMFGITGDLSFNRNKQSVDFAAANQSTKTDIIYFTAGPSFHFLRTARFEPFARLMGGGARTNFEIDTRRDLSSGAVHNEFDTHSTDLALMVGGGLDMRVNDRVKVRLFQIDYAPIFLGDRAITVLGSAGALQTLELEGQRQDQVRVSFGVTF
jgi:opacity protein-like surface antigen